MNNRGSFNIRCGSWEEKGRRKTMEDRQVYIPSLGDTEIAFVGVYDGHGGVSSYC
jgi:serine/threonine protein phosphatase PrpC